MSLGIPMPHGHFAFTCSVRSTRTHSGALSLCVLWQGVRMHVLLRVPCQIRRHPLGRVTMGMTRALQLLVFSEILLAP